MKYGRLKKKDIRSVKELIHLFYQEYPDYYDSKNMDIDKTIQAYWKHPDWGEIWIIELNEIIIGYAIINKYWSNEFGGLILFIDEIYIKPEFRLKTIATNYMNFLIDVFKKNCVRIQIEVRKTNKNAIAFYDKLGFCLDDKSFYYYKKIN